MTTTAQSLSSRRVADAASQLSEHFVSCRDQRGTAHKWRCVSETVYDLVAPRLVTTTAALLLLTAAIGQLV